MAPVLAALVILLTGQPTTLTCGVAPPGMRWTADGPEGYASPDPPAIWLERCDLAWQGKPMALRALAHEILHVRYPWWRHARIYATDTWYADYVVWRWLTRLDPGG